MRHGIFALFENLENDEKKSFKEAFKTIKFIEKLGFDEAWISEHHFNSFSLTSTPALITPRPSTRKPRTAPTAQGALKLLKLGWSYPSFSQKSQLKKKKPQ